MSNPSIKWLYSTSTVHKYIKLGEINWFMVNVFKKVKEKRTIEYYYFVAPGSGIF